ncbi:MAG: LamG domain-containing protein [Bifidobacteriaceae bacterium]|nr:LamG domain-containing protein [Bifidobacteriaceae bacterium]
MVKTTQGSYRAILNKGGNDTDYPGYSIMIGDDNQFRIESQDDTGSAATKATATIGSGTTVSANTWTHVAVTWKAQSVGGDGIVRLYLNGTRPPWYRPTR